MIPNMLNLITSFERAREEVLNDVLFIEIWRVTDELHIKNGGNWCWSSVQMSRAFDTV